MTLRARLAPLPLALCPFLTACGNSTTPATPPAQPQIVYESPGIPGAGVVQQLYTMNLDGSHLTQITHDGLNDFLAHFSPTGDQIVYTKFVNGQYGDPNPQTDIFLYTPATATEVRLTNTSSAFQAAWSPDGLHLVYATYNGTALALMNPDGSAAHLIGQPSGAPDDLRWDDPAWSSDNWILFTVAQNLNNCFKVRLDKMRPDGSSRTQVTDGGPNCSPPGMEPYGDADPGFSADGQTIYSSRGLAPVPGAPAQTLRHLYAVSSSAWTPGKPEIDLSQATYPDCVVGVPKGSPDGTQILVYLRCNNDLAHAGNTLTDTTGSSWTYIAPGFGADWNPAYKP
jgi:Tol biopolymer transport system component